MISCLPRPLRARLSPLLQRGRSGFARNVFIMLSGTVLGQGASVLLAPILTRIYSPDEFGFLSVFTAALAILSVVAALGLEIAIPITETEEETARLTAICWIVLGVTTAIVGIAAWFAPAGALGMLSLQPIEHQRWLVPAGFACVGAYYIMVALATRLQQFEAIARTRISQGLGGPISQIVLGLLGLGSTGLAIGFIFGQSAGTGVLIRRFILQRAGSFRALHWRELSSTAMRYVSFPLYVSWARILDVAGGGWILYPLISSLFSPTVAGFMFLSDRVIGRPLLIVSTSLLQVFTGEAGRALKQDPAALSRRFRQVVPRQTALAAAWILIANLAAAWVFPRFFGPQWGPAVPYLRALSFGYLAGAVLHPLSTTLQMLEKQITAALWQIFRMAAVLFAIVFAWHRNWSATDALWLYSGVQAVAGLVMIVLIAGAIRQVQVAAPTGSATALS